LDSLLVVVVVVVVLVVLWAFTGVKTARAKMRGEIGAPNGYTAYSMIGIYKYYFSHRTVKFINNTPRLTKLPQRLILQLVKPKPLRPPYLQPSSRGRPVLRGRDAEDDDGESVAVFLCAEGFAVLCVEDAD
jgi:hypothetical protein